MRCTTRYYAKICQIDILNVTREESSAIHFSEFSLLLPDYLPFCPCFLTTERPCCCMFSANKQNLHSPARTRSQKKQQSLHLHSTSSHCFIPVENSWKTNGRAEFSRRDLGSPGWSAAAARCVGAIAALRPTELQCETCIYHVYMYT